VIFVTTKKDRTTHFFPPLYFVAAFASEIRDPGWTKIRIRNTGRKYVFYLSILGIIFNSPPPGGPERTLQARCCAGEGFQPAGYARVCAPAHLPTRRARPGYSSTGVESLVGSFADPDPESCAFLTSGSRFGDG
jgi:hypothetical protein